MSKVFNTVLVEGNKEFLKMLEDVLDDYDNIRIIDKTGSLSKGIEICKKHEPDLVLVDVNVKGDSGLETAAEIKKLIPNAVTLVMNMDGRDFKSSFLHSDNIDGFIDKDNLLEELESLHKKLKSRKTAAPEVA